MKGSELSGILSLGFRGPRRFMDHQYPLLICPKSTVEEMAGSLYKSSMNPCKHAHTYDAHDASQVLLYR